MRRGNVFGCICLCACLCICLSVCNVLIFESLNTKSSFSYAGKATSSEWSSLVKFLYKDHQVKVKVIGSKSVSLCWESYILPVSFIIYFFQTAERPRRKYIRGWILNQGRKIDSGILPIPPLLFTEGAEPAQTSLRLSILP